VFPGWECSEHFARKFERKISNAFSEKELDALAERTGFKIRQSKLTPTMFVDTLLFKEMDNATVSLEDHCIALKQRYNVTIKKQSLAERFDVTAVKFIQELLNRHLSNQISLTIEKEKLSNMFQHFSSIKIKDSTRFQISECFKEYYPGSTGAATGAGVHIQFEFDILNGLVSDLSVTDALQQDMTNAKQTMDGIEKGSLIIRDLGYFSTSVLEHIRKQGAYYITRPKSRMIFIHAQSGQQVNINSIYQQMKRNKLSRMEIPVIIGDQKLCNRLIIEMLPEKEVQRRVAKANREAEKKGRNLSAEYRSRARLNLFITNVPVEWIATPQIRKMYQIRWQIELRFKAWKSFYDIDAIKKMQRYRFECYLYSTLLLLLINLEIANNFFSILWKYTSKPLSLLKFYKTTSQNIVSLRRAIMERGDTLLLYLAFLYEVSHDKLLTEKRKDHSGSLSEILSINTID
jgi:Transposase DDE domain